MNLRQRILSIYHGETPDVVPCMLDLSHWFYHKNRLPWDLSKAYDEPERELIAYHKRAGVGFYIPNLARFFDVAYAADTQASVTRSADGRSITWRLETPLGEIERTRFWDPRTYAWAIADWGVRTEQDLRVLAHALGGRLYGPRWENFEKWEACVADCGVNYAPFGYSAMGQLLHYWMGVEATIYATFEWPGTMREVVEQINANNLEGIDQIAASPADIVILGDNFSSDVQPPAFFNAWSRDFYVEAITRLHAAGKFVSVHIDGRLRGSLAMMRDAGADCADAVTPAPMGDLTAAECRREAGPDFILSGGVSPDLWLPGASLDAFKRAVLDWLELRHASPRLIAAAGDQTPPGTDEDRIAIFRDLVETHGAY